jgi:hypothetical protein
MCGNSFKKVDHIDCNIIAFKVKKKLFLHPAKSGLADFEFPWLIFFSSLKVEIFDIIVIRWIEIPREKEKSQKRVIFIP